MNFNRNTNTIATLVATILCGCPGLFGLCFGATSLIAGFSPGAEIDVFGSADPASAQTMGFLVLCLSIVFIITPAAVWFATRPKGTFSRSNDESVPPAS